VTLSFYVTLHLLKQHDADGKRHGESTAYYYEHEVAANEEGKKYYLLLIGGLDPDPENWYAPCFILEDLDSIQFWRWVELETRRDESTREHYEAARSLYWEKYQEAFKLAFPDWNTRKPMPPIIPPGYHHGGGSGSGNGSGSGLPSYLDKLKWILDALCNALPEDAQPQLLEQMDALMTIGSWVEAGQSFQIMSTSSGIYQAAHSIYRSHESYRIAIF
jgi:hypothetical protein